MVIRTFALILGSAIVTVVVTIGIFTVVIMIFRALHVDATMKVTIGLVDHGTTDRLPRIAEGNGKDALALCHLGHGIRQSNSEQGKSDGGGKPDCQQNRFHITHAYA